MTRINTVSPKLLPTPWLVAEYRELPRILNRLLSGPVPEVLPATYRMGAGHVTFFYDKAPYLAFRHFAIVAELKQRNPMGVYTIDLVEAYDTIMRTCNPQDELWTPSPVDHIANLQRLRERWKGSALEWSHWVAAVVAHHELTEDDYRFLTAPLTAEV